MGLFTVGFAHVFIFEFCERRFNAIGTLETAGIYDLFHEFLDVYMDDCDNFECLVHYPVSETGQKSIDFIFFNNSNTLFFICRSQSVSDRNPCLFYMLFSFCMLSLLTFVAFVSTSMQTFPDSLKIGFESMAQ